MSPTDPISVFDQTTLSYTYDNGWSFTNSFEGHLRVSEVPRGVLREHVEVVQLREDLYFLSWVDDEMGLLAQTIDFATGKVVAAIPADDERGTEILTGHLTKGDD